MADGCHLEKNSKNRHTQAKIPPISTKFGTATHFDSLAATDP